LIRNAVCATKAALTSYRIEPVKTQDARNTSDAILAHQEVAVKRTGFFWVLDEVAGESVVADRGLAED